MTMDSLYAKPGHLLRRAHQISVALFTEECAEHDLTSVQYAALVAIDAHPGVDATRLSGLIAFDRSTLGGVIERLEAKRLIHRESSPADKRIKLLYLSPAGKALLGTVGPAIDRVQERILAPLRPADRTMLIRLLSQLVELHHDTLPSSLRPVADREGVAAEADGDGGGPAPANGQGRRSREPGRR